MNNSFKWPLILSSSLFSLLIAFGILLILPNSGNIHGPATRFDEELGWSMIKNFRGVGDFGNRISTNSLGLRGHREVDSKKAQILLLGDSVAWGLGVDDEQTVAYYLEQKFEETQVLNAGVSGYGIDQYYLMLKRLTPYIKPSVIITLIFTGSDIPESVSNIGHGKSKPYFLWEDNQLKLQGVPISKYSCQNVATLSWALNWYPIWSSIFRGLCQRKSVSTDIIGHILKAIHNLGNQQGAKTLFVLSGWDLDFKKPKTEHLFFRELLKKEKLPFIDVTTEATLLKESPETLIFDEIHLSALGSQLYSKVICNYIKEHRWITGAKCD